MLRVGKGTPAIVVHGGPGFDHTSLSPYFEREEGIEYIFYDQCGCGIGKEAEIEINSSNLVTQLLAIIKSNTRSNEYSIICHSWGAIITLFALKHLPDNRHPNKLIMVSPCPLDYISTKQAVKRLLSRVTLSSKLQLLWTLIRHFHSNDSSFMNLALPYYCAQNRSVSNLAINLNIPTYLRTMRAFKNFNVTELCDQISSKIFLFRGIHDYILIEELHDIQFASEKVIGFKNSGHFIYAEESELFNKHLQSIL